MTEQTTTTTTTTKRTCSEIVTTTKSAGRTSKDESLEKKIKLSENAKKKLFEEMRPNRVVMSCLPCLRFFLS